MKLKIFTVPNTITCLNLVSGCLSINSAFSGDFLWAFLWIVLAAVFDFLDGFAARLLKSPSEIGKELDSLADAVSFGAAPAFILYNLLTLSGGERWENYLVFIVAAFSALRLAKFNLDTRQTTEFIGLPTPANALLIASTAETLAMNGSAWRDAALSGPWYVIAGAIVLSLLLTSEIPMFSFKFKHFGFRENALRYIFLLYAAALLFAWDLKAVPVVILSYILVSVVRAMVRKRKE